MRKTALTNREFYHVYNRGVDKRILFSEPDDLQRFLKSMELFNTVEPIGSIYEHSFAEPEVVNKKKKLVNIICYCVNPNHYHMLLEQSADNGISEFIKRLAGGYTKYFNIKYKRSGVLFQGKFKSIHVNSNEYLLHLSAYINLNNRVHGVKGGAYASSFEEYEGENVHRLCKPDIILEQFSNRKEYKNFTEDSLQSILEKRRLYKELEHFLFE